MIQGSFQSLCIAAAPRDGGTHLLPYLITRYGGEGIERIDISLNKKIFGFAHLRAMRAWNVDCRAHPS